MTGDVVCTKPGPVVTTEGGGLVCVCDVDVAILSGGNVVVCIFVCAVVGDMYTVGGNAGGDVVDDAGRLIHLYHKSRFAGANIIRSSHACKDLIDNAEIGCFCRNIRSYLRQ